MQILTISDTRVYVWTILRKILPAKQLRTIPHNEYQNQIISEFIARRKRLFSFLFT